MNRNRLSFEEWNSKICFCPTKTILAGGVTPRCIPTLTAHTASLIMNCVMARPKKSTEDKRTHRLPHVRCTAAEYAQIQARSAQAGIGTSEFVRRMVLDGTVKVTPSKSPFDFALVNELNKIGTNLNQLTRIGNSTGQMPGGLEVIWKKLDVLLDQIIEQAEVS